MLIFYVMYRRVVREFKREGEGEKQGGEAVGYERGAREGINFLGESRVEKRDSGSEGQALRKHSF